MFEITKIRARRINRFVVYSLAIYGAICLFRGCDAEAMQIDSNRYQTYHARPAVQIPSKLEQTLIYQNARQNID